MASLKRLSGLAIAASCLLGACTQAIAPNAVSTRPTSIENSSPNSPIPIASPSADPPALATSPSVPAISEPQLEAGAIAPPPAKESAFLAAKPQAETAGGTDTYTKEWQELQERPCEEIAKTEESVRYSLCALQGGLLLKAASAHMEMGDGLGYWLKDQDVRVIQSFHSGEVFFFNKGVLEAKLLGPGQVQTQFSAGERQRMEQLAATGVDDIAKAFGI